MSNFVKLVLVVATISLVTGCKPQNYSYAYLVQHPYVLEKEYNRCQALATKLPAQVDQCRIVDNAVKEITDIIREQRNDPEKFGLRILVAQMAMQNLQKNIDSAQQALDSLNGTAANESELKSAQDKLHEAILAYNSKQEETKMLLSIMGVNTPE